MSRIFAALLALLLCASLAPVPTVGDEPDDMLRGLDAGKLVPLTDILAKVRRIAPGKVIDVELEYDDDSDDDRLHGRWIYEIEVLTERNQVIELELDAETGQLLEIEGAPWPPGEPRPSQ